MELILASASARREELLKKITEKFEIIVSDFDENKVNFHGDCAQYVMELAKNKALNVSEKLNNDSIVIGCDTIVSIDDQVLGKPKDENEAFSMLKTLSGNRHKVFSGLALVNVTSKEIITDFAVTDVKFDTLSDEEIRKYVSTGEPMDKAGAYGIQGKAGIFIEEIHGCYYNVVGLPLNKLYRMLEGIGVNL